MKKESVAVVIISNGPGELTTWVKPVISCLKKIIISTGDSEINYLLRLILVPCPNATGNEYRVANKWVDLDLVTPANYFWKLLLKPSLFAKWPKKGIVVFLGGDQFWSVLLGKRLGYEIITYAEWVARWPRWNFKIAAMNNQVKKKLPIRFKEKCIVIGDLMNDIKRKKIKEIKIKNKEWIAILPGSKKTKLSIGVPYFLQMADYISDNNNNINFIIPLAPTVNIEDYFYYLSDKNPIAKYYSSKIKVINKLKNSVFDYVLETNRDSKIYIFTRNPAYEILNECSLAITTVGANTAELAAINLPMIVVLPTQHLSVMNAWDGIYGIIGKVPIINKLITVLIKKWYLKKKQYFSWPNIKAKKLIVPERIGDIYPEEIGDEVLFLMKNKEYLEDQKQNLSKQRGEDGAVKKLSQLIINSLR